MGLDHLDRAQAREEVWEEAEVAVWEGWVELVRERGQLENAYALIQFANTKSHILRENRAIPKYAQNVEVRWCEEYKKANLEKLLCCVSCISIM